MTVINPGFRPLAKAGSARADRAGPPRPRAGTTDPEGDPAGDPLGRPVGEGAGDRAGAVDAARGADGPDFEEFVAARSRSLFRVAHLLTGDRSAAEDLLQTVFEKAYPRWRRIRRAHQPEAYVRKMLVNQATDMWRSRRGVLLASWTEEQLEALADFGGPGPRRGRDPAEQVVLRQTLIKALRTLPEQMRAVLILRHWEGLGEQETADLLGVSVGSVKSQASRGLQRLRGVVSTDGSGIGTGEELRGSWP